MESASRAFSRGYTLEVGVATVSYVSSKVSGQLRHHLIASHTFNIIHMLRKTRRLYIFTRTVAAFIRDDIKQPSFLRDNTIRTLYRLCRENLINYTTNKISSVLYS